MKLKIILFALFYTFLVQLAFSQVPQITSFFPTSGVVGTFVTIVGNNFASTHTDNTVYLGGVKATTTAGTATSLTFQVPAGAVYSALTVTNNLTQRAVSSLVSSTPYFNVQTPTGTLSASSYTSSTISNGWAAVSASFNTATDNRPDIALGVYNQNYVTTQLRNPGNTGFNTGVNYSQGFTHSGSASVGVGDVNTDGILDLVVGKYNSAPGEASVLIGASNGTFAAPSVVSGTRDLIQAAKVVDLNNDGLMDVITVSERSTNAITILYRNPSNAGFETPVLINGPNNAMGVDFADFNEDGRMDFVVASYSSNQAMIFLRNAGNTNFDSPITVGFGAQPWNVATGDFNNDGNVDIAASMNSSIGVNVIFGNGSGGFGSATSYAVGGGAGDLRGLAVADMNGDGFLDIVTGSYGNNNVRILLNSGTGTFPTPIILTGGVSIQSVALADFNGDGYADILAGTGGGGARVYMYVPASTNYTTRGNAAWGFNGNWSTDGGLTDCGCNPAGQSGITVNINHEVDVFAAGEIGVNNTINLAAVNSRLNLHVLPSNIIAELNGVSGSNLVMLVNGLPAVATNNFITTPNTTVQFVAPLAGAVPDNFSGQNYQNLAFMNGAKTMNLTTNRSVLGFIDIYDNLTITSIGTATLTATNNITLHNAANLTISSPAKLLVQGNMVTIPSFTGSVSSTAATLEFDNLLTAKYIHNHNGGTIPTATWRPLSECRITGMTLNTPTGFGGQSFGNLTWDCINQQTYAAFNANFNIQGTLRVENTRDGATPLGLAVSDNGNFTITTQNFIMNNPMPNSAAFYPYGGSNAADVGTLEVTGDFTIANQVTGVLSGIGKSRILLTGANNATFNYNASFTFSSDAIWEVEVAKTGAIVAFTSPINFISFEPASGNPASILRITSGEAIFFDNLNLSVGVIAGNGTLSLLDNAALYLRNQNILFDNTFAGTLNASTNNARVFYDASITQTIFRPSTGAYHNLILLNAGTKNLTGNITLTGNWTNNATGTFNAGTNTVTFAGSTPQLIDGATITEFRNLSINNNVSLSNSIRLAENLVIAANNYLTLSNSNLIALHTSNIVGGGNNYIVSNGLGRFVFRNEGTLIPNLNLVLPIGYASPSQYAGLNMSFNNINNNSELRFRVMPQGVGPAPTITATNRVDVVWEVELPSGASVDLLSDVTFLYNSPPLSGTLIPNGRAYYHDSTNWVAEALVSSNDGATAFTPSTFNEVGTRYYGVFAESLTYYSRANGNWNDPNTWSTVSHTGPAAATPPALAADVIIGNGHTVTSTLITDLLLNQNITIEAGSQLVLQNGNTNLVSSFVVNGTLRLEGGTLNGSSISFNNGSAYVHARNGGVIPTATWQTNSECRITGISNSAITGGFSQNFGDFTWNCPSQSITQTISGNMNMAGVFSLTTSGTGAFNLGTANFTVSGACGINGNLIDNNDLGTNVFNGGINIGTAGTWNTSAVVSDGINMRIAGDITHNNTTANSFQAGVMRFVAGTNLNGGAGAAKFIINHLEATSGGTPLTNNHQLEVRRMDLFGIRVFIQGTNSLLQFRDASILTRTDATNTNFHTNLNTVEYIGGSGDVYEDEYSNLTINTTDTKTLTANIIINGNFTLQQGLFEALSNNIELKGDWLNNSSFDDFDGGDGSVIFNGTAAQTIGGSVGTRFANIVIDNNVFLNRSIEVSNQVVLSPNHYLTLNINNLTLLQNGMGAGDILGGSSNSYIITNSSGRVIFRNISASAFNDHYIFAPLGYTSPNKYAALNIPVDNFDSNQEIRVRVLEPGNAPAPAVTSPDRVDAVWEVILPFGVSANNTNSAEFFYMGNVIGNLSTGLGRAHFHNGTNWVDENHLSSDAVQTSFNLSVFSGATRYFAVFAAPNTNFFTLANDAIWSVNSNLWSNDGTTPCNCSPNGVAGANVRIRHNAFIPVGANVALGTIINIENPVILTADFAFAAAQLLGVSGARLSVTFDGLPFISGVNSFATTAGTIIEFAGGAGTLPNQFGTANYRNVVISGTGNKTFGGNITIQENLTINSGVLEATGFDIFVNGTTTIASGATFLDATSGGINEFQLLTNNGIFVASGGGANTSEFRFQGDINNNGTFDLNCNCPYNFNKSTPPLIINPNNPMTFGSVGGGNGNFFSNTTIENGQIVTFNVTNAANLLIANDVLVLNNNATGGVQINGNGTLQGSNANSTWRQGLNAFLGYASDQVPMSIGVLDAFSNENTVSYNRNSNQNLKGTTYRNLELSNTGIKTIPIGASPLVVLNPFTIPSGITFRVTDGDFTANSSVLVNGVWEDTEGGGTSTFNGTLNVGSGATMAVVGLNTSFFVFNNNIVNQGTFNLTNSTQWRFNSNLSIQNQSPTQMNFAQPNSGTGQINNGAVVTILDHPGGGSIALCTNNGQPIRNLLGGVGSIINLLGDNGSPTGRRLILETNETPFTNADNAVVEYNANVDIPTKVLTANNNLFIYAGNVGSVLASTFHHVNFTGTSTLGGNISVIGNLNIANAATLNAAANNINLRGNWVSLGTFNGGIGSVIFEGTNPQTITSNANSPFNNININNLAHVQINNAVRSGSITFTAGRLQTNNFDFTLTAIPATDQITQSFSNASTSYIEVTPTGGLVREGLLTGNLAVFPIGDATAIRHIAVTPNPGANVRASFDSNLVVPAPTGSTSVAAGRWLVSGTSGVLNFYNTGATSSLARVHRLNASFWDNTGITTIGPGPTYTTNSINFATGEIYTLFATAPVTIVVNPTNPNLPIGEVGIAYTQTFTATGGTAPYTFAVTAGTLPSGLTLNSATGELSGIPTTAGSFNFTITATDTISNTGSQAYTLVIGRGSQSVVRSTFSYIQLPDNKFKLSASTTQGLQTKFFSDNTEIARIENGEDLVIVRNVGTANIFAYQEGNANVAPSDTALVMIVNNFSLITALADDLNKAITLYPNPSKEKVWLKAAFEINRIDIYNVIGQIQPALWQKRGDEIEIEIGNLSQGVYLLHIHTPFGLLIMRVSKL